MAMRDFSHLFKDNPIAREIYEKMERDRNQARRGFNYDDALNAWGGVSVPEEAKNKPKPKKPKGDPWAEVKGLEDAKRLLQEAIEKPITHKKIYAHYNKKPPKGILLYGPPGCGKTLLGKAASASINGDIEDKDAFIYVSGPELMDKFVGETERKIRELFARARKFAKANERPGIIFLDEADSLLMQRGSGPWYLDSQVNQFLTEMDGMSENSEYNPIVILATNRKEGLDTAILREGRVDYKIPVMRPCRVAASAIIEHNLGKIPLHSITKEDMIAKATDVVFSDSLVLKKLKVEGEKLVFRFKDIINGAMLAQMVEHAKAVALRRDIAANKTTGISWDDMKESIEYIFQQNKALKQEENLAMFLETNGYEVN